MLEERGFAVMLVDPRRIKNVPGRKSGVLDCQWLRQLHTCGLLPGAFRPEAGIRRLRSYLRQRAMLVEYAAQHVQHMHKALTQLNVKLRQVISDITGKTGMTIAEAIVGGERDPRKLAQFRDPRTKADEETIALSLEGHWPEEHIFELTQALELYRVYPAKIAGCDREIETQMGRFDGRSGGAAPAEQPRRNRIQGNAPRFDVRGHQYRMTGVDLTRINGVGRPHGVEGNQRGRHRYDKVANGQAFRLMAGIESQQPGHRRQGHQLPDQAQRQPGSQGTAAGGQRAVPLQQCVGSVPAPQEGATGTAQGHYGHGRTSWPASSTPCCAMGGSTWMTAPTTTRPSTIKEHCGLRNGGRRSWVTNWHPHPMIETGPLICPWQPPRPARENLSYSIALLCPYPARAEATNW